ncbi:MAG: tetratricopeptide repeat protein, partial [Chloroflexota bacterium]|nr:tetratricopeptide repeat protein [Chloroflexota bacterium]
MGEAAAGEGDTATAHRLFGQSLALTRAIRERRGIAWALINLGRLVQHEGNSTEAAYYFAEALALRRELGDRRG